jgi:hypothetical protein
MTASKPDMEVLAVGVAAVQSWLGHPVPLHDGRTLVLCEAPAESAEALPVGCERDWCSPGFVVKVGAALVEAGIGKAGGPGIEQLAQREAGWRGIVTRVRNAVGVQGSIDPTAAVRSAVSRANALAQAVQSIGQTLGDMGRDLGAVGREALERATHTEDRMRRQIQLLTASMSAISEIVESVAADVVAPTQTAREVLAAHGWVKSPVYDSAWAHEEGEAFAYRRGDTFEFEGGYPVGAAELRAFAQLAEESQP